MRKAVWKVLIAILVVPIICAAWPAVALADERDGDWFYTITSGEATITGYMGTGSHVAVPSTLGGCPVAALANYLFSTHSEIMSVQLPDTLEAIGGCAFQACTAMTSITFPSGLQTIGSAAFYNCDALTGVNIPSAATIQSEAFLSCDNLENAYLPPNLTSLGSYAFRGCVRLRYVDLPDSLTAIPPSAFLECSALQAIDIPRKIASIGDFAFGGCSSLDRMFFYGAVPAFGASVFSGVSPSLHIYYHVTQRSWVGYTSGYTQRALAIFTLEYLNGVEPDITFRVLDDNCMLQDYPHPLITRTGYAFDRWYKEAAYTNPFDNRTEVIKNNMVLYAKWVPDTCAVTFDSQGGSAVAPTTAPYGATIQPPANPTLAGYAFGGWYKEAACTNPWNFYADQVQGDTTLYARWLLPSQPDPFTAASASYRSIALSWGASANATGYEIWRATTATGAFSLAGYSFTTGYTDTGLTINKSYYYKVRAFKHLGDGQAYGAFTAVKSAKPKLAAPAGVTAARKTSRSIKVAWSAVSGATKYEVYRCLTATGTYKRIATIAATSYTNTGLVTGRRYYYKVKAYRLVNGTKVYSGYSAYKSARP